MLNQLKLIVDELFRIWHTRYQPTSRPFIAHLSLLFLNLHGWQHRRWLLPMCHKAWSVSEYIGIDSLKTTSLRKISKICLAIALGISSGFALVKQNWFAKIYKHNNEKGLPKKLFGNFWKFFKSSQQRVLVRFKITSYITSSMNNSKNSRSIWF